MNYKAVSEDIKELANMAQTNLAALAAALDIESEASRLEQEVQQLNVRIEDADRALDEVSEIIRLDGSDNYMEDRKGLLKALKVECLEEMVEVYPLEDPSMPPPFDDEIPDWKKDAKTILNELAQQQATDKCNLQLLKKSMEEESLMQRSKEAARTLIYHFIAHFDETDIGNDIREVLVQQLGVKIDRLKLSADTAGLIKSLLGPKARPMD